MRKVKSGFVKLTTVVYTKQYSYIKKTKLSASVRVNIYYDDIKIKNQCNI